VNLHAGFGQGGAGALPGDAVHGYQAVKAHAHAAKDPTGGATLGAAQGAPAAGDQRGGDGLSALDRDGLTVYVNAKGLCLLGQCDPLCIIFPGLSRLSQEEG